MEASCFGGTLWSKWPEVSLHPSPAEASLTGGGKVYMGVQRHSPVKGWCSGHEGNKGGMEVLCMKAQTDGELRTFSPRGCS